MAVTQGGFKCSLGLRRDDANGGALVAADSRRCARAATSSQFWMLI